uniref:Uncharacterized protein n=1 Tax=Oryza sativa subsp. japonica TaxID=39947 RepID=Q6K3S2_ORYSJ|nr:hypothetical protein [Oryza sativa Japonica Group]BAD27752.1 hypothetical protein [Oryza sativa Japonica Group]
MPDLQTPNADLRLDVFTASTTGPNANRHNAAVAATDFLLPKMTYPRIDVSRIRIRIPVSG